jgi:spore coat protein H
MDSRKDLRKANWIRQIEKWSVGLGVLISLLILMVGGWSMAVSKESLVESADVTAQANAMPNQGWAPLSVYFSAYGSQGKLAEIRRYEWDLDGNGQMDFDSTSQGGYATYIYSKPGDYIITLRVTDTKGRYATDQVRISVRIPASSSVDYWTVFDKSLVRRIDLGITQSDWDQLWVNPEEKTMVPAQATIFGERLSEVGIRMRGQFSLRESGNKKPWVIDTDAYIDGQEFHNLHQLLLLNNIGDPTLLKEVLAYEMMEFVGLPASHSAFVELWFDIVDDEMPPIFWGVYTLVERVDNKYLANRFGQESTSGNLYKASHAKRGPMDLIYYGDQIEDYPLQNGQYAYGKMNNEDAADYTDVINLCRAIDGTQYPNDEAFINALESIFNVDAFLRYMAVVTIFDNWDIYPNTGNNYYLFDNPVSGKFEWIPWDLTWGTNPQAPFFGQSEERLVDRAPLYDRVFQIERYRNKYAAYIDLLLRIWFTPGNMTDRVQTYHKQIAPYIIQDKGDQAFFGDRAMFPYVAFVSSWQTLIEFTQQRGAYLQNFLSLDHLVETGNP